MRLFAQDEWVPFEGARWWVEVAGHAHRLDSSGFETNYGPLYQSRDALQVIAFRTFRNTVDGGLRFDLDTGRATPVAGPPSAFETKGWRRLDWQPAGR